MAGRAGAFGRHVMTLATGTVAAQAIPFAVSPVLTRIFTPRDFAMLAVFLGVAGPASIVATARYELAIVLPTEEQTARAVRNLVLMLGTAVSAAALLTVLSIQLWWGQKAWEWLFAVPAAMLASSVFQAFAYWANRHKAYRHIAIANVVQQVVIAAVCVGWGLAAHGGGAVLVAATVIGQLAAAIFLFVKREAKAGRPALRSEISKAAKEYWRFPAYNLPYSFVGTFSAGALPIMLSGVGYVPTAGLFAQARRILYAPANLLAVSIGQVYFREAATSIGQPSLEHLTLRILRVLAWIATPVYVYGTWWAPEVFSVLFGKPWREAGVVAQCFGPVAFCYLFTSWPERIYEVTANQRLSFVLQVLADGVSLGTFIGLLLFGVSPIKAIAVYSALYCGYHVVYLCVLARIARFSMLRLAGILRDIAGIGILTGAALLLVHFVPTRQVVQLALGGAFVAAFAVFAARRLGVAQVLRTRELPVSETQS